MKQIDRWALVVGLLLGRQAPDLPELPGRIHTCVDDRRERLLPDWARLPPAEAARRLGITKNAATRQIRRARQDAGLDADEEADEQAASEIDTAPDRAAPEAMADSVSATPPATT